MTQYNIYFGTNGKTLGYKYRCTKVCENDTKAKELAKSMATSFYFKNEGKFGLPNFSQISKESEITGVDLETLYQDHIKDMMRWHAIPTSLDTIPNKRLKF
jgi:hypothetical protein